MHERLNKSLLYTYGIADLGFVLVTNMELFFFAAFLTDHADFSLSLTGYILGFTSLADIAFALAGGIILQKLTLRYGGKYRSWFLVGPPFVAALFILQFTRIGPSLPAALIIIFGFTGSHLIWNIVFTACASMVGRLSQWPDERTLLSVSRAQGMSAAGIIFSVTSWPLINFFTSRSGEIAGFSLASTIYALVMVGGYLYLYFMTTGRDPYDENIYPSGTGVQKQSVLEIIGPVFKNPPLMFLIAAETFRNSYIFIVASFAIYYFKYVLNDQAFLTWFMLTISISRLLGTFAATWIGVRIGKRRSYWIFLVLAAAAFASGKLFAGTRWSYTMVFGIGSLLGMVATAMSTALFSDTVVYGEWKTGKNIRAFTMALQTFPIKVGNFIRSGVITFGLMAIGFVANRNPSPEVVEGISSIMSFTPGMACIVSAAIFYFGYSIEDNNIRQMEREILNNKETRGGI